MTKNTGATIRARLASLEQAQRSRRGIPLVAFYRAKVEGDAEAVAERFHQQHGRPPAVLLPYNGREAS